MMRRLTALTVLGLTISACLGSDFAASVQGQWILESGDRSGQPIVILDSNPITMRLDGNQIGGTAACNSYGGRYRVASTGNFQLVDGVAVTEMACSPAEVMESERQYLEALARVDRIAVANSVLTLSGNGYTLRFAFDPDAPPPNTQQGSDNPDEPVSSLAWFGPETLGRWVLESGTLDGSPIPMFDSHPITFEISDQGFGGTVCNHYGFAMPLPADGSFPDVVSTMMLCFPEEVMDSETAYLDALRRFESSTVIDGKLVIEGDGVELVYIPAGMSEDTTGQAVKDLAARIGAPETEIEVIQFEEVTWNDGSLGCPQPGMVYTQALVDGYRVILGHNGRTFPYHAGGNGKPFLCESGS